ncbi:MAG: hypothetical protein WAT36_08765 [Chromatiaceae bacterium]
MTMKVFAISLLAAFAIGLNGCGSLLGELTADVAGVGGAALASTVTDNAAMATGIGLGVRSAAHAGLQKVQRKVHTAEQDAIAQVGGTLAVGAIGEWNIKHQLPIEDDARGRVTVSRLIGAGDLNCREIVFSVDTLVENTPQSAFYVTTICRDGPKWKWASAEPATERWGSLQ